MGPAKRGSSKVRLRSSMRMQFLMPGILAEILRPAELGASWRTAQASGDLPERSALELTALGIPVREIGSNERGANGSGPLAWKVRKAPQIHASDRS